MTDEDSAPETSLLLEDFLRGAVNGDFGGKIGTLSQSQVAHRRSVLNTLYARTRVSASVRELKPKTEGDLTTRSSFQSSWN